MWNTSIAHDLRQGDTSKKLMLYLTKDMYQRAVPMFHSKKVREAPTLCDNFLEISLPS